MGVASLPLNKEVRLQDVMDSREEVKLAAYKTEVLELVRKYSSENCSVDGKQASNLTNGEIRGITSLRSRCKNEDLVIMETDKSKRLSMMTKEYYIAVTETHVIEDRVPLRGLLMLTVVKLPGHLACVLIKEISKELKRQLLTPFWSRLPLDR